MNPTDGAGNILNEKDAVVVHLAPTALIGKVTRIKEASIVMSKGNEMRPGSIDINLTITVNYDPRLPVIKDIFKIVKPPNWDKPES